MKKPILGIAAKKKKQPFLVSIPPEQFEKLRTDKTFIQICKLTRYINQLLFCFHASQNLPQNESAVEDRQIINASLFIAGIMYEALKFCTQLEANFKDYYTYKNEFSKILANPLAKMLRQNKFATANGKFQIDMNHARNKITFHVDEEVYEKTLNSETPSKKKFSFSEYRFIRGEDKDNLFTWYFDLTDNITVNFLIKREDDDEREKEHFLEFYKTLMDFTTSFISAAMGLTSEYVKNKNWKVE
jgi:hypothetical protein